MLRLLPIELPRGLHIHTDRRSTEHEREILDVSVPRGALDRPEDAHIGPSDREDQTLVALSHRKPERRRAHQEGLLRAVPAFVRRRRGASLSHRAQ